MSKRIYISFIIAFLFMPLFGVLAEEESIAAVETSVLVADTIVNIDKDTRILTLRNEEGEDSTFTAGPEVQNFDQFKRGDLVLVQYFNAFAISLKVKKRELKEHGSQLGIESAKQSEKTGARITRISTVISSVEAVDQKNSLLTVREEEQNVALSVSEHFDLSTVIVGDEVEVTYIESYAINIEPASKILGKVTIKTTSFALGVGWMWGQGELTMYDGSTYTFDIEGISVLDIGISIVEAKGDIYRVVKPKDIEGKYWTAEIGISYGDGVSALAMKNSNDVILKLTTKQRGIRLTLAAEGLKIKNITPK